MKNIAKYIPHLIIILAANITSVYASQAFLTPQALLSRGEGIAHKIIARSYSLQVNPIGPLHKVPRITGFSRIKPTTYYTPGYGHKLGISDKAKPGFYGVAHRRFLSTSRENLEGEGKMGGSMTTLVGTQPTITDALQSLLELEYDALEAYDASINRIQDSNYKAKLEEFKSDHKRHIEGITKVLKIRDIVPTTEPSLKHWLTEGKVVIGNLMGDEGILKAMLSNEGDTNTAYERMNARKDLGDELKDILEKGLSDERKHKRWLEDVLSQ